MGLAPAKGTRPRAEVGRAVEMRQGWPDKAAGEGEAEGRREEASAALLDASAHTSFLTNLSRPSTSLIKLHVGFTRVQIL